MPLASYSVTFIAAIQPMTNSRTDAAVTSIAHDYNRERFRSPYGYGRDHRRGDHHFPPRSSSAWATYADAF